MTREEFEEMDFDEAMEILYQENDYITTEDMLIDFVKHNLHKENYLLAKHVLDSIYDSEGDSRWYYYIYNYGTLCTPECLNNVDDVENCGLFR